MTPSSVTKVVVMIFRISDSLVNKGVAAFVYHPLPHDRNE
jgi:hypothetical protein